MRSKHLQKSHKFSPESRRHEITPNMMREIEGLLEGRSTEEIGEILGCSGNSIRACLRGKTLSGLTQLQLDRMNLILDAIESGRKSRETPISFEIEERKIEVRVANGLRMFAEKREEVFLVEVRQPGQNASRQD